MRTARASAAHGTRGRARREREGQSKRVRVCVCQTVTDRRRDVPSQRQNLVEAGADAGGMAGHARSGGWILKVVGNLLHAGKLDLE